MKIIGVDLGLKALAGVVLDIQSFKVEKDFLLSRQDDLGEFLVEAYDVMSILLNKYSKKKEEVLVVVEKPFALRGYAQVLEEVLGVIRLVCTMKSVSVIFISPSSLKKFVVGSGKAVKSDMVLTLFKKFGIEFKVEDLVDAFWLAYFGYAFLGYQDKLTNEQKKQVNDFRKKFACIYEKLGRKED